jgi:hypothetical protein
MKIITRAVLDMRTMKWVPELEESYEYSGIVAMLKETSAQDQAAQNLTSMTKSLQNNFAVNFSAQQAVLNNINNSIKSIIAAGPSQYGFSAQQDAALRTQASEGTAAAYRSARQATGEQLAAIGGGNTFLPSGTSAVLNATVANKAAAQESSQQLGITEAGWQQGNQNYLNAVGAGENTAKILDPSAYSSQALSGANDSFNAETTIANEPTTAGVVGGILGSVAGAGLSGWAGGGFKTPGSCWVAAACFNEDFYTGEKTNIVRNWLYNEWSKNWYASPILALYTKFGKWIASKPLLVRMLKPLFEHALKQATL